MSGSTIGMPDDVVGVVVGLEGVFISTGCGSSGGLSEVHGLLGGSGGTESSSMSGMMCASHARRGLLSSWCGVMLHSVQ